MRRILVTGSREWLDEDTIALALWQEYVIHGPITVVHGKCPSGADKIASDWVKRLRSAHPDIQEESHPAKWSKCGNPAGIIRNQEMVDLGADICLAFPTENSRGTIHCIKAAKKAGIETIIYEEDK